MMLTLTVDRTPHPPHIRILIVDDLAVVRSGLKLFIRAFDDLVLVGEAASGDEAVPLCAQIRPDVVLMDLEMPGLCSVAAARLIRYHDPQIQVIAMSSFQGEGRLQNMLDNGAIGCLLKNISSDDLAGAIRAAYLQPRPEREATEPSFTPRPNVPCQGQTCPWGWNCRPTND
jgi:two-component system, NarL family, response regulator LiaR